MRSFDLKLSNARRVIVDKKRTLVTQICSLVCSEVYCIIIQQKSFILVLWADAVSDRTCIYYI